MVSDEVDMEFLHGDKLAAWIKKQRPDWRALTGDNFARALFRWENDGSRPNYYEIDHYLIQLDIYDWEIPDEFWTTKRPMKKSNRRLEVEALITEGYYTNEIMAIFADKKEWMPRRTINKWTKELKE